MRGDLAELLIRAEQKAPRGEITLLIGPASPDIAPSDSLPTSSLPERVDQLMREKMIDRKAALKLAARERGLTKREAYKELLTTR